MYKSFVVVVAVALAGIATPAAAQTTNCNYGGGSATCYTSPGVTGIPPPPDYSAYWRIQQEQQRQLQANLRAQAEARAQRQADDQARSQRAAADLNEQQRQIRSEFVGRLIASGDCAQAKAYALNEGDLTLAAQVATLCSTPAAPPRP